MRQRKKFFKRLVLQTLIPVLLMGGMVYWLLYTTSGLKSTIRFLQLGIPGTLNYGSVEGSIAKMITLNEVNYQSPSLSLQSKTLSFKITLLTLFQNTIHLPEINLLEGRLWLPEYSHGPIVIQQLIGRIKFETPRLSEAIVIDELKATFENEPVYAKGYILIKEKQLQEVDGIFNFGQTEIKIKPDSTSKSPTFLWDIHFHPNDDVHIKSHGTLKINEKDRSLEGEMVESVLSGNYIDTWTLKNVSSFILTETQLQISPLHFENADKIPLLLEVNWDKIKGKNLKLDIPEFALRAPQLKGKVSLKSSVSQAPGESLTGYAELQIKPGNIKVLLPNHKRYETYYEGGKLIATLTPEKLNVELKLKETERNHLQATVEVPHFSLAVPFSKQPLQGSVSGSLQDLSLFYLLAPPISRLKGIVDIQGKIEGTLTDPQLNINATLKNGIFSIPKQRVTVKEFSAQLTGQIPGTLQIISQGMLGEKPFLIKGSFEPFNPEGKNIFDITGDRIRVYNTADIHMIASPTLRLEIIDHNLYVSGTLQIHNATITQKDELTHVVTSNDIVLIQGRSQEDMMELSIIPNLDLLIDKEDNVHFKGYGLDANVRGRLKIERREDGLMTGKGRLTIIEGKYRLQGSQYHIYRGHLLYHEGTLLNDPLLDIRIAKKQAGQIEQTTEVGIYVQGSLQNPAYHLYSNDNLENTEILSRMGFGNNQAEGVEEKFALSQTAALFLSSSANPVIESLQEKLGLEELGIQSAESQKVMTTHGGFDSVLVVGKTLTKNIYVQFIQGMLEPLSLVRLKYFLSPKLAVSLETSTYETVGADLSFSVEQN